MRVFKISKYRYCRLFHLININVSSVRNHVRPFYNMIVSTTGLYRLEYYFHLLKNIIIGMIIFVLLNNIYFVVKIYII